MLLILLQAIWPQSQLGGSAVLFLCSLWAYVSDRPTHFCLKWQRPPDQNWPVSDNCVCHRKLPIKTKLYILATGWVITDTGSNYNAPWMSSSLEIDQSQFENYTKITTTYIYVVCGNVFGMVGVGLRWMDKGAAYFPWQHCWWLLTTVISVQLVAMKQS